MKTYTLTYKSSQDDSRLVVVINATGLPHVIKHARQMLAIMPEDKKLTYTIHRNGDLVWEESCTK